MMISGSAATTTSSSSSAATEVLLYGKAEEDKMGKRLEAWVQHHITPQSRQGLPRSRAALLRALRTDLCSLRRQVVSPCVLFERLVCSGHIEIVRPQDGEDFELPEGEHMAEDRADDSSDSDADGDRDHGWRGQRAGRRAGRGRGDAEQQQQSYKLVFHSEPKPLPRPRRVKFDADGLPVVEVDGPQQVPPEEEVFATRSDAEEVVMRKAEQWALRKALDPRAQPTSIEAARHTLAQLAIVDVGYPAERLVRRLEERGYISFAPPLVKDDESKRSKRPKGSDQDIMTVVWHLNADKEKRKQDNNNNGDEQAREEGKPKEKRRK